MASLPIIGGIALLIGLLIYAVKLSQKSSSSSSTSTTTKTTATKTKKTLNRKVTLDPEADAKHILNNLTPDSTPLDILYTVVTSPDNITVASKSLELRADVVERKHVHLAQIATQKANATLDQLLNDDDDEWADDDDENSEAAKAAQAAREEKKKQADALAKATGNEDLSKVMLEGVDDDVLGMQWVKTNLTQMGVWPPPSYNNSKTTLDAPTERNLIMTMGRLNARTLNTHPELQRASAAGKIDPTYFQSTMEFRQRVNQQLDNVLRFACTLRSFQLVCSVLDAMIMFKIGLMDTNSKETTEWFDGLMRKQYGESGMPKLVLEDSYLGVPTVEPTSQEDSKKEEEKTAADKKEEEKNKLVQLISQTRQVTTTDDKMSLELQINRPHAEAFTHQKLAQCASWSICCMRNEEQRLVSCCGVGSEKVKYIYYNNQL